MMNNLHIDGETIVLGDPAIEYLELIGHEQERAQDIAVRYPDNVKSLQSDVVNLWTTANMIAWDRQENHYLRNERDIWLAKLAGGIVLDIGCGAWDSMAAMQRFVKPFGPTAYIGLDQYATYGVGPFETIPDFGIVTPNDETHGDALPGLRIHGDALEVVSRLPDDSMNIVLNGIDNMAIDTSRPYGKALVEEVARVAKPGGLVFGATKFGGVITKLHGRNGFESQYIPPFIPPVGTQAGYYFASKEA